MHRRLSTVIVNHMNCLRQVPLFTAFVFNQGYYDTFIGAGFATRLVVILNEYCMFYWCGSHSGHIHKSCTIVLSPRVRYLLSFSNIPISSSHFRLVCIDYVVVVCTTDLYPPPNTHSIYHMKVSSLPEQTRSNVKR